MVWDKSVANVTRWIVSLEKFRVFSFCDKNPGHNLCLWSPNPWSRRNCKNLLSSRLGLRNRRQYCWSIAACPLILDSLGVLMYMKLLRQWIVFDQSRALRLGSETRAPWGEGCCGQRPKTWRRTSRWCCRCIGSTWEPWVRRDWGWASLPNRPRKNMSGRFLTWERRSGRYTTFENWLLLPSIHSRNYGRVGYLVRATTSNGWQFELAIFRKYLLESFFQVWRT